MITRPHRLRVLRAERGKLYSQAAVAAAAGISYNRYWRIENAISEPTPDEQKALAKVFGVRVADVFPAPELRAS